MTLPSLARLGTGARTGVNGGPTDLAPDLVVALHAGAVQLRAEPIVGLHQDLPGAAGGRGRARHAASQMSEMPR